MGEKRFTQLPNSNLKKELPQEKIREDFLEIARTLLEKLDECEEQLSKGSVKTYGDFLEKTSEGKEVLIRTICATGESDHQKNRDLEIKENIEVIAINPVTKKILGIRRQDVVYGPLGGDLISTGEIVTKNRGQGIATVIENTIIKVLQRVVDRYQTENYDIPAKVTWVIKNQNQEDLETMIARHNFMDTTDASKEELKEKKEEQVRWQALYGKDGKLGAIPIVDSPYNILYQKEFYPHAKESELPSINKEDYQEIVRELRALF